MDIVYIDMEDNRSAYDAESIEGWEVEGMPAGITREFMVRLGNISGDAMMNVPVGIAGTYAYRITLSFKEYGSYADGLTLTGLADGKSQNLFIKLTMPLSVEDETVTSIINKSKNRVLELFMV